METLPAPFNGPSQAGSYPGYVRSNVPQGVAPIANGVSVAKQLFPNATITSGYRAPGTKLRNGLVHDGGWHTQSHGAIDVAPIQGMTFQQYVQRYRDAGYTVIEALDEQTHPSKWATGPHWHIVLGERR